MKKESGYTLGALALVGMIVGTIGVWGLHQGFIKTDTPVYELITGPDLMRVSERLAANYKGLKQSCGLLDDEPISKIALVGNVAPEQANVATVMGYASVKREYRQCYAKAGIVPLIGSGIITSGSGSERVGEWGLRVGSSQAANYFEVEYVKYNKPSKPTASEPHEESNPLVLVYKIPLEAVQVNKGLESTKPIQQ